MNNSLVFGKDSSNVSRAAKCTTDGRFIMDIDKSNDVATETTLKQVKTAIENINVNVGDITLGEISVASNDTTTHAKLDTLNATLTNKTLNKLTSSIDISGQTITVANLNTVAQQTTLNNINQNIPQMESDNDNRLKINTEGQSISVGNNVLINGAVTVSSGSISVSNFPSTQQIAGSVNVSNMITGYATETTAVNIKSAIDDKHLSSGTDSVSVVGSVSVSNFPTTQTIQGTVGVSNAFTLDTTSQLTNTKLDTINTTINNKTLNKLTSSIDISGQSVNIGNQPTVNVSNAFTLDATTQLTNTKLDDVNTKLGDISLNVGIISEASAQMSFITEEGISKLEVNDNVGNSTLNNMDIKLFDINTELDTQTELLQNIETKNGEIFTELQLVNTNILGITGYATETTLAGVKGQTDKMVFAGDDLKTVISNQITGFATETTLTGIKGQTDKLVFNGDNLKTELSNQITGFATETTLAGIKTQTDKLVFNGDNLKTELSNQITGFATETTLNGVKTQTDKLVFNGDNLKTEIGNQITGFSTETTLSGVKTQTDKLIFVGDDLKAVISNTSFESKLRDGNNNIITSTAYGIDGVRGLDVSIKNATQAEPLNVAIDTTTVPLNVSVDNYPLTTQIVVSGDTPLSAVASSLYTNLRDATGAPIGINGNPLKVDISNSVVVETGTNSLDVNITGGTITAADGKAFLYSGDEASSISATVVGGKTGIDSNIINSSIDTHCFGSSNGTTWHHLSTDANGQLNVHSKIQDGAGTDITSTTLYSKTSLDTASNMYADFSGTRTIVACDTNGKLQVNSFLKDAVGNNITSTDTTATTQSLDTASCLYTTDSSVRSALTSTAISSKRALDVSVANTSAIPVSGTFYPATQPVSGSVNIGTGAVVAGVSVLGNDIAGGERGVNTASCLYARAPAISGVPETPLTCIINGSRAYLETRDEDANTNLTTINTSIGTGNSTLSTINGKLTTTTNDNSVVGLNVYQIYPKKLCYVIAGANNSASTPRILGGCDTSTGAVNNMTASFTGFGAFYPRQYYVKLASAGSIAINFTYVNSSGNIATGSQTITSTTPTTLTGTTMLGLLDLNSSSVIIGNMVSVLVANDTTQCIASTQSSSLNYFNGALVVPNGYVGILKSFIFTAGTASGFKIFKYNANNAGRKIVYWNKSTTAQGSSGEVMGTIYTAGEAIVVEKEGSALDCTFYGAFVLEAV